MSGIFIPQLQSFTERIKQLNLKEMELIVMILCAFSWIGQALKDGAKIK